MTDNSIMIFIMARMTLKAYKIKQPQRRFQMSPCNLNFNDNICLRYIIIGEKKDFKVYFYILKIHYTI